MSEADKIRAAHEKYERIRAPRVFPHASEGSGRPGAGSGDSEQSGSNDDRPA